jgi:hypothetical protein
MITARILAPVAVVATILSAQVAVAQMTTSAAKPEELEAIYTQSIENRAQAIIVELKLTDAATTAHVHDAIIAFYRALRARDAVADSYLEARGMDTSFDSPERIDLIEPVSNQLQSLFEATLAAYLTPEQTEIVKDQMTYNKVNVTYDAYCEIIPNLTDAEKDMILKQLKAAREEAVDGGSADEKHAIFETFKVQINARLVANGHDVEKAFKDWEAKHAVAQVPKDASKADAK